MKQGFTLIECLVVIIILSLIAAYAVVRWPGDMIQVNAESQQLASMVRYTQTMALSKSASYRLNFTSNGYSMTDINGNIINDPVNGQSSVPFSNSTTVSWVNLPNNVLTFDGQGIPYIDNNGQVLLQYNASFSLTRGNATKSVSITPVTGRVRIQ